MEFWKMNGAGNDFIIINNIKRTAFGRTTFRVRKNTLQKAHVQVLMVLWQLTSQVPV